MAPKITLEFHRIRILQSRSYFLAKLQRQTLAQLSTVFVLYGKYIMIDTKYIFQTSIVLWEANMLSIFLLIVRKKDNKNFLFMVHFVEIVFR